jgi:capsular exopolysaccharide synthesis family protein
MQKDQGGRQDPVEILDKVGEFNPPINVTAGRTMKLLILAALCALVGTSGLLIALDNVDRRLRTVKQAEQVLPAPVLAAIPQPLGPVTMENIARATELHPQSLHSEAYHFLGLHLLSGSRRRIRSLMVLSAKAEQGSAMTVSNLGITLAQAGQQVIIVDANIRSGQVHEIFGMSNEIGLTDLLRNPDLSVLENALQSTTVPGLRVITSGAACGNPWELFRSQNLIEISHRLRDLADYVIYDTPSALAFTDALNLAPVVDAAYLCVRALESPTGAEERLCQLLQEENVEVIGSVLSDVPASVLDSYTHYHTYYPATDAAPSLLAGTEAEPAGVGAPGTSWIQLPDGGSKNANDED